MQLFARTALIVLLVLMIASAAFAGPKLGIDETTFDFGYAPQNSKVTHVFWLHSIGDDTLKILNVKPG